MPWVFLSAASMIEYLSKLVNGSDLKSEGYKQFIKDYLAQVRPEYASFTFRNGRADLPEQMYHILRCGIVHNYSLIPDAISRTKGGRDRSIVLTHRGRGYTHLGRFSKADAPDAVVFVAEDFIEDLNKVVGLIFSSAKKDDSIKHNIESWLKEHPPIEGIVDTETDLKKVRRVTSR